MQHSQELSGKIKLYIVSSNIHHSDGKSLYFKILNSCERVAFKIKGSDHWHVRYQNNAYRLYNPKSMKKAINLSNAGKLELESSSSLQQFKSRDSKNKIEPTHYCVLEQSPGHFFRFF